MIDLKYILIKLIINNLQVLHLTRFQDTKK